MTCHDSISTKMGRKIFTQIVNNEDVFRALAKLVDLLIRTYNGRQYMNNEFLTSSIVLPGRAILRELIFRIGLAAGAIFSRIAQ